MVIAAVLIVAITALVAWFVYTDLGAEADFEAYCENWVRFYPHDPRPLTPLVTIQARPHLYDWDSDDLFVELRQP